MADDITAALRRAGLAVMRAAQLFSGWSERIPATGHVTDDGPDQVRVVFGGPGAPHAITFEAPHAAFWKHPVFATGPRSTWRWAPQIPPRRFLLPAADIKGDVAVDEVAKVVSKWALEFGFHPQA